MRKIEIVEHVINNTTISRSQAIQAVDCAFDAIEKALCKGESVYTWFWHYQDLYHKRKESP